MNQTSRKFKTAFIQACWHETIVDNALVGFVDELAKNGFDENATSVFKVPGVFEIPLLAKRLANTREYDCIVAAGFVVDGGIYRHDFVSASVVNGLMQVQLELDVPVFSVVLTPHNYQESEAQEAFFRAHFIGKGREAAKAVLMVVGDQLKN